MNLQTGTMSSALAAPNPWAMVPPLGNLDAYISAVNRMPMLTLEQEQKFARQLRDDHDVDAAGKLVMSHLRLVVSVARQYLGYDDLAPDPHDLLDSALAACTVLTLELYIRRRKLAVTDLRVDISHVEGKTEDGRVRYQLQRSLHIEGDITPEERAKLLEIANKCPIHRVLEGETSVTTALVD